jgi:hypothetical protein
MADNPKSQIKAALSTITERDRLARPHWQKSQRDELSALARAHHERLQSELAKAGLDFARLEQLHDEFEKEAEKLFEKRRPPTVSKPTKPSTVNQAWAENKRQVYKLLAGRPSVTFPYFIVAPLEIYADPPDSLLEWHIASWDSWARWRHMVREAHWVFPDFVPTRLRFVFAWRNETALPIVVRSASCDISLLGQCHTQANPPFLLSSNVDLDLWAYEDVVAGSTITSDDRPCVILHAYTPGFLSGGEGGYDYHEFPPGTVKHVACHDILVPSGEWAIFDVGLRGHYYVMKGEMEYQFEAGANRVTCPALVLELSLVVQQ